MIWHLTSGGAWRGVNWQWKLRVDEVSFQDTCFVCEKTRDVVLTFIHILGLPDVFE